MTPIPIKIVKYIIQFDPRLKGWIAYRNEIESTGRSHRVIDHKAITMPKREPYLAARSLARQLKAYGD